MTCNVEKMYIIYKIVVIQSFKKTPEIKMRKHSADAISDIIIKINILKKNNNWPQNCKKKSSATFTCNWWEINDKGAISLAESWSFLHSKQLLTIRHVGVK